MIFTMQTEFVSVQEGDELKYFSSIFEPKGLNDRAEELTEAILGSPFSQRPINFFLYDMGNAINEQMQNYTKALAKCFKSANQKEGVVFYLKRPTPEFEGK